MPDLLPANAATPTAADPTPLPRLLYTPGQAAVVLGISRSKVYELLAARMITTVRIGACRRIPVAALEEFVESLLATPDPFDPGLRPA